MTRSRLLDATSFKIAKFISIFMHIHRERISLSIFALLYAQTNEKFSRQWR